MERGEGVLVGKKKECEALALHFGMGKEGGMW